MLCGWGAFEAGQRWNFRNETIGFITLSIQREKNLDWNTLELESFSVSNDMFTNF
jgi:hypothetical protein